MTPRLGLIKVLFTLGVVIRVVLEGVCGSARKHEQTRTTVMACVTNRGSVYQPVAMTSPPPKSKCESLCEPDALRRRSPTELTVTCAETCNNI